MNNQIEVEKDGYVISTNPSKIDVSVVHDYLSKESYWAKGVPMAVVQKSIENSLCFGLYFEGKQVGFARLITDRATFAYLADVFVLPEHRKKGLSKWMMEIIHDHPELQGLRRWLLGTRDAHTLYEQFGWTRFGDEQKERFMQFHNPDVYNSR
jgi:GNAT superfamily N-acetyltransferase